MSRLCHAVLPFPVPFPERFDQFPIVSIGGAVELWHMPEPGPRQYVIDGLEEVGTLNGYYGSEGVLKSWFAMERATCIASGLPFLGRKVRQGPVLMVDTEGSLIEAARRAYSVARGRGMSGIPENLHYLRLQRPLSGSMDLIRSEMFRTRAVSVSIDSLSFGGVVDLETTVEAMATLNSLGVNVVTFDHQARVQRLEGYDSKLPFGSRFKEAGYSSLFQLEVAGVTADGERDVIVRCVKNRSGAPLQPIGVRVSFLSGGLVAFKRIEVGESRGLVGKLPQREQVFIAVRDTPGSTSDQIAEFVGLTKDKVKPILSRLKGEKRVIDQEVAQNEPHKWFATPAHPRRGGVADISPATATPPETATPATPSNTSDATPLDENVVTIDFGLPGRRK